MIYGVNFDLFSSFIESLWGGEGPFFVMLNFNCGWNLLFMSFDIWSFGMGYLGHFRTCWPVMVWHRMVRSRDLYVMVWHGMVLIRCIAWFEKYGPTDWVSEIVTTREAIASNKYTVFSGILWFMGLILTYFLQFIGSLWAGEGPFFIMLNFNCSWNLLFMSSDIWSFGMGDLGHFRTCWPVMV